MLIRPATHDDLSGIAAILNAEISGGTASWTETPKSIDDMARWLEQRQGGGYPVLVAEDEALLGYASYGPFRAGEAYRPTVEHTVYVARDARRRGVGRALMVALIAEARATGLRRMAGWVSADQVGSLALHRILGFEQMARLDGIGEKRGTRLDGCLVMLRLD